MSVNLNTGLFAQNFQVKNNAVQKAPSVSLSTPLAGDKVDFSFKKAQNKVGFKAKPLSPKEVDRILLIFQKGGRAVDSSAMVWIDRLKKDLISPDLLVKMEKGLEGVTGAAAREFKHKIKIIKKAYANT